MSRSVLTITERTVTTPATACGCETFSEEPGHPAGTGFSGADRPQGLSAPVAADRRLAPLPARSLTVHKTPSSIAGSRPFCLRLRSQVAAFAVRFSPRVSSGMVRVRAPRAIVFLIVAGWLAVTPSARLLHAASEAEVKNSIDRGVRYLRSRLLSQSGGQMALTALALAKAGVTAEDPELKAAVARLQSTIRNGVYTPVDHQRYEAGVALMAFATLDAARFRPEIEAIARYLLEAQESHGGWYYPAGGAGIGQLAGATQGGDTSITQYALLGLWEAQRAGVPVSKKSWDRAAAWHLATQLRDGSFTYHPNPQVGASGTHSMAVAGTSSLFLLRLMLYPEASDIPTAEIEDAVTGGAAAAAKKKRTGTKFGILIPAPVDEPEPKADATAEKTRDKVLDSDPNYSPTTKVTSINNGIVKGIRWLGTNFRTDLSTLNLPAGGQWNAYYLYGIERLGALSGLAEFNGRDWYQEGCDYFVKKQTPDGSWNIDQAGQDNDTCFAVLFMVRATEKTLKKTPQRRRDPRMGGGILVGARGLPEDLSKLELGAAGAKVRKLKGPIDELLAELEKLDGNQVEAAQEAIVDTILTEDPEALVGQQARLLKLAGDRRPEVRRTAVWALGRTNDLSVVPTLIARLEDPDLSVIVEARNAIRFMTRQPDFLTLSETPAPEELQELVKRARTWYLGVRPYAERDDLLEGPP